MNRVIKFRGKRLDNEMWIYGDLMQHQDGDVYVGDNTRYWTDDGYHNNNYEEVRAVDDETVGQYTGLKDAKGREIYEGDIILTPNKHTVIVKFGYREWIVQQDRIFDSIAAYGWIADNVKDGFTDFLDNTIIQGEVIGNIHDNPELLNQEK